MWYLDCNRYQAHDYPRHRLYLTPRLDTATAAPLAAFASGRLLGTEKKKGFVSGRFGERRYFCKIQPVKNRGHRLKTTLGIKRRGSYYRPVAEVANHLRLSERDYLPTLIGFGYRRNRYGLIDSVAVVTEYVDASSNVLEFIERRPEGRDAALDASFALIARHLRDGFVHLDLWAGNILLSDDLSRSWLIDLEHCRLCSSARFAQKMGFCCAYFYCHTLSAYLSEADYLARLQCWLRASGGDRDSLLDIIACVTSALRIDRGRSRRRLTALC